MDNSYSAFFVKNYLNGDVNIPHKALKSIALPEWMKKLIVQSSYDCPRVCPLNFFFVRLLTLQLLPTRDTVFIYWFPFIHSPSWLVHCSPDSIAEPTCAGHYAAGCWESGQLSGLNYKYGIGISALCGLKKCNSYMNINNRRDIFKMFVVKSTICLCT